MRYYHLWTIGCQMNKAESQRIEGLLRSYGYEEAATFDGADLIALNTCVVRQSAEDRVVGTLGLLQGVKRKKPGVRITVTGCFTALGQEQLQHRHPHVDLFFGPGDYDSLAKWLDKTVDQDFGHGGMAGCLPDISLALRPGVSAYVPVMQGCNNFCTYCIVPYTRGREVSRTPDEIESDVRELVAQGAREVVLLGQNVDSYGHDLPGHPDLASVLERLQTVDGLLRIRFLTNHPKDMTRRLIHTMSALDKVCEHLDLALQSGDNAMLRAMGRGYTVEEFTELVADIRRAMPSVSISTDIIVGFPAETPAQFENTYETLRRLRFDVVHVAAYSPRPGTVASRKFEDDVPAEAKSERLHRIECLQEEIAGEINARLVDTTVEVLVEGHRRGKWYGRTRTDKLVFFEAEQDTTGQMVHILIDRSSPWALQGHLVYNTDVTIRRIH
ncbi:MAG: tRNA (N6-isopentenyl adenosine(37)-C2)-methylthiotransferase MiaB [Chloroflexota bacterium]